MALKYSEIKKEKFILPSLDVKIALSGSTVKEPRFPLINASWSDDIPLYSLFIMFTEKPKLTLFLTRKINSCYQTITNFILNWSDIMTTFRNLDVFTTTKKSSYGSLRHFLWIYRWLSKSLKNSLPPLSRILIFKYWLLLTGLRWTGPGTCNNLKSFLWYIFNISWID